MTDRRILVVEDEPDIARLLALHLGDAFGSVTIAADGHEGMRRATDGGWNLIVLDLRLPGRDGLSICRTLRREHCYVPIVMLTSKSAELDRVHGLDLGADDYVTKPFSIAELIARIKAIFRRVENSQTGSQGIGTTLRVGPIAIDPASREVRIDSRSVELTAREFDLLRHFAEHPGQVFRRTQLLDSVWGYGHDGYEHTVNSHINRLRAKIEPNPAEPAFIVTVWGVGYKLETPGRLAAQ